MSNINIDINAVDAQLCKLDYKFMVKMFWDTIIAEPLVWNWHMDVICDALQEAGERVIRREKNLGDIVINVPPGTSKSTLCTVMFPVWLWINDPTLKTLAASYSGGLSSDHSVKSRDIIKSEKFKRLFPDIKIRTDIDGKTHFANTAGGERYATSVRGTAMGKHAHVIIIDDPIDPKGVESEADRTTASKFMNETLPNRKVNKSITLTVLVMQRLHRLDPTGDWLERKAGSIQHICLPAEVKDNIQPPELVENYVDGLLDIKRLDRDVLNRLRQELGSYSYAGQMLQSPAPDEGGIWQSDWILPIDDFALSQIKLQKLGTDWDLAYTKHDKNSASAYITAGFYDGSMYITDLGFKWLEFPDLIDWMKSVTDPHFIEAKASGISARQVLKKNGIPATEVKMGGKADKVGRARMVTKYAESGMVYCAKSVIDKLLHHDRQGIVLFPNNANNDLADALVQAINRLLVKKKVTVRQSRVRR